MRPTITIRTEASLRAAHLEGRLALPNEIGEPQRRRIRERNWRR
jgi:hypothetical protein